MKIGSFALVQPFTPMATQFRLIREMGLEFADLTDNHDGATLGVEYGFAASVSLDSHPAKIREMAAQAGVTLTSFCAHANLLDPPSPDIYSTTEIIKAIRLAALLGIRHVITTEGDPKTEFGHSLSHDQRMFAIRERLYTPILWAEELGVELLLEPHGIVTDSADSMEELLDVLGHQENLGICLDTGNSWLGGSEPLEFIRRFGRRIKHVHWKDLSADWQPRRGRIYGCGMATIPLGDGVVGIREIVQALTAIGFDGATTLEIAGPENIRTSTERLRRWLGEFPLVREPQAASQKS
ncbi:MAG: sugar phosphate isomerase/epimerase [Acidobacteria bacterium]|nr:sugar phosphate isomerase/epimerase [Acidobacteriota bacterium]